VIKQPACTAQTNAGSFGCVKNTIRLRSGLYFDFVDPQPDQFTLADIAGALSKICRFGGQVDMFYSVAEHCWHCSNQGTEDQLPPRVQASLLFHDAAEAFCGDVVKPLKIMLAEYSVIEHRVEKVIAEKFGLDFEHPAIREIDHAMLIAERKALFSKDDVEWFGEKEVRILKPMLRCWGPTGAEQAFIKQAAFFDIT